MMSSIQQFYQDCLVKFAPMGLGLGLEVSISDVGTGLNAGIPKAFPDICIQPDIFHKLRPVGAKLARLERKAEKLIADEATLEKRASGKRPQKKTLERLNQIHEKVDMAIQEYDLLRILFCWLVELTGFSGYTFQDACGLAEWVLSEMEASFPGRTKLLHSLPKRRFMAGLFCMQFFRFFIFIIAQK